MLSYVIAPLPNYSVHRVPNRLWLGSHHWYATVGIGFRGRALPDAPPRDSGFSSDPLARQAHFRHRPSNRRETQRQHDPPPQHHLTPPGQSTSRNPRFSACRLSSMLTRQLSIMRWWTFWWGYATCVPQIRTKSRPHDPRDHIWRRLD